MRKISVVCCTYNGASFIRDQLNSILQQTRLPDEVIICDDGSTDATLNIVEELTSPHRDITRILVNQADNLGSTKNFERGILCAQGDIIVLSDQDDVWIPTKLESIEANFEDDIGFIFSDGEVVDECLQTKGFGLFESLAISKHEHRLIEKGKIFDVLLRRNIVTGAAMAFSSKYKSLVLPISESWVHDGWIALLISSVAKAKMINFPLFMYRQHSKNQIGARKFSIISAIKLVRKNGKQYYLDLLAGYEDAFLRIQAACQDKEGIIIKDKFHQHIQHLRVRCRIAQNGLSIGALVRELMNGNYHRYSRGFITFGRDVVALLFLSH